MKPPSATAMLIGHPAIAFPASLGAVGMLYGWSQQGSLWPVALPLLVLAHKASRAHTARNAYLHWQQEWDGMADPAETPAATPARWRPWAGAAMLAALGLFFAAHASDPLYAGSLAWLLLTIAIAGMVTWLRRRRGLVHPKPASKPHFVTACVQRPLLPVPGLQHAYQALPPHCHALLGNLRS